MIFPNRRTGLFFTKYLKEIVMPPFFAPQIITINDLIGEFSQLNTEDNLSLLFRLYKKYTPFQIVELEHKYSIHIPMGINDKKSPNYKSR